MALLLFSAMLLGIAGCSGSEVQITELWVLTEESRTDGMNYQAELIAEAFEEAHPGMKVRLDILPTDPQKRETYLQQLRTQIMSGGGPDVYLLPTGSSLSVGSPKALKEIPVEPLFSDVKQCMYSGLFWDISQYYDGDSDLNKGSLHPDLMAAGCVERARYVLPLRFDLQVMFSDEANWAASGLDESLLAEDLGTLTQAILESDATNMAACGLNLPNDLSALPQVFDYEKGELLVTAPQIADYMRLYQAWKAESSSLAVGINEKWKQIALSSVDEWVLHLEVYPDNDLTVFDRISNYLIYGLHWTIAGFPLYTESAEYVLDSVLMGKRLGQNVTLHPQRNMAGQTCAQITYYGAVGSGCPRPDIAYEFLRAFLSEEYQWDRYRPRVVKTSNPFDNEQSDPQCYIQVECSLPVRITGAVEDLWDNRQYQLFHATPGTRKRILGISAESIMTEDDLAVLTEKLDAVSFPITQATEESFTFALSLLNDENGQPTEVNIDELAQQVYENLWWHLAEG